MCVCLCVCVSGCVYFFAAVLVVALVFPVEPFSRWNNWLSVGNTSIKICRAVYILIGSARPGCDAIGFLIVMWRLQQHLTS